MNKDTKNIFEAYRLLSEISRKDMDLVRYDRPVEDLPFDNIFGNKLRIVIPIGLGENSDSFFDSLIFNIEGTITHDKFKAKFPNILKFIRFDYKTKKAIVRIRTQMGEKDREETLASLVDKMFKAELLTKEYRDKAVKWIEQNVSQILPSSYAILSRSILDNLRMSDISGIESCHSPGGGYYASCLSEAAGGGVIAFVIDGGELQKKQIENIETDEEIFSDKDRSVEGLDAVYRLRMRKYHSEELGDFVLPETKVYQKSERKGTGNSTRVPGLVEVITDFLKSKQDLDKDTVMQLFTDKDIVRKGGSYEDTADNYLFNQYFGGTDFKGNINYEEEESFDDEVDTEEAQAERRYNQFREELAHFLRRSGVIEAKHVSSAFDVQIEDDYVWYNAFGNIEVDLDDIELIDYDGTDDELKELEPDELRQFVSGRAKSSWLYPTDRKFRFYKELFSNLKRIANVDEDNIRVINFQRNGYTINMEAHLQDYNYEDGTASSDVDNYPPFLRILIEWSDNYDKIKTAIVRALSIAGYADLTESQKIQYGLADFDETKREFDYYSAKYTPKNLRYEGNWATFILQTGINPTYLYAFDLGLQSSSRNEIKTQVLRNIKDSLTIFVQEKMDKNYDTYNSEWDQDRSQEKLKLENFDMDTTIYLMSKDRRHSSFEIQLKNVTNKPTGDSLDESPTGLAFKVSFEVEDRNTLSIKAVDEGLNDVKNIITGCMIKYLVPEEKRTFQQKSIMKTYNAYINGTPQNPHQI